MKLIQSHFWNFEEGSQIEPEKVEGWRNEVIKAFENDPELKEAVHRSGNGMVIGRKVKFDDEEECIEIFEIHTGYRFLKYEIER